MDKRTRQSKQKVDKEELKRKPNTDNEEADDEGDKSEHVTNSEESESEDENEVPSNKKAKIDSKGGHQSSEEYEVDFIVEDRKVKGKTQYRVRWKGFSSAEDTWEDEDNLDCDELVNEYLNNKEKTKNNGNNENSEEKIKKSKGVKKKPKGKKLKSSSGGKKGRSEVKPDENGEFVISKILDMHVSKNGKHEFHVVWKGFPLSESSWEPEENVKDTAAYERFLKRLEEAKSASLKQLRVARTPTDRFTLTPQSTDRRASRRFENKQRVKYYDAE
ncbi:hypothetical protein O3M35_009884 [Rhynocoris fuscipes]|uniref:Chromo domain-containing protein n=1 Tax=Rhynocoris fuscipes TaxID=488301 RepID=A0AAW1D4P7_9HEMI